METSHPCRRCIASRLERTQGSVSLPSKVGGGSIVEFVPSGETPRGIPLATAIVEETRRRMLSRRILREGTGRAKKGERELFVWWVGIVASC